MKNHIALLLILMLYSPFAIAQKGLEKIKKKIPVANIKGVEKAPFGESFFYYYAQADSGLWNSKSKTIIATHLKNVSQPSFKSNLIIYSTAEGFGLYDLQTQKNLLRSTNPINLVLPEGENVAIIINKDVLGFYIINYQKAYLVNPTLQKKDTTLLEASKKQNDFILYDKELESLGYFFDYFENEADQGISKTKNLLDYYGQKYSLQTGEPFLDVEYIIDDEDSLIVSRNTDWEVSYYSPNLELLFKDVDPEQFTTNHFKILVNKRITNISYLGKETYLCYSDGGSRFYSSNSLKPISPSYNYVFPIGYNNIYKGFSFFTFNKKTGFGVFNLTTKEVLAPQFNVVEERMDSDGNLWLRADSMLFQITSLNVGSKEVSWESFSKKTSILINHIGINQNKLVVSTRSTSEDTHDSNYYTSSEFDDGSGVIDLEDSMWLIKPTYHTFTPFKNHYVAMQGGQHYNNASYLATSFFDKDLMPISSPKMGYSFIFNDILLVLKGAELVEYDIEHNKVIRTLGKINDYAADFTLKNGYLILGDNNYINNRFASKTIRNLYQRALEGNINTGALNLGNFNFYYNNNFQDMDILDVVNPEGKLIKVPLKRYSYVELYDNDLVVIGRIKEGEQTDRPVYKLSTDGEAIFDLRTQKFITPWYRVVGFTEEDNTFYLWDFDSSKEVIKVALKEVRKKELLK